jgi:hypothetical protein
MQRTNARSGFRVREALSAACLLGFSLLAMAQSALPDANPDALTVRISADGVCYFLDGSAPCGQLGKELLAKHLAQHAHLHFAVDRAAKYEVVAATLQSLQGTGFKVGYVNYDAHPPPAATQARDPHLQ